MSDCAPFDIPHSDMTIVQQSKLSMAVSGPVSPTAQPGEPSTVPSSTTRTEDVDDTNM